MTQNANSTKQVQLQNVADEYHQQGYDVIVAPSAEQLPEFLRSFSLDILAYSSSENVIVEVRDYESLTETPKLDELAKVIDSQDGWRIDLVVSNQGEPHRKNGASLNKDDIAYRLQEANQLSAQEHGEAALILAVSALEAILRRNAQTKDVPVEQDSPLHLIKSLFTYGLLSKEQYQILRSGVQARNTIVHGYKDKQSFSGLLQDLLTLANQLIDQPLAA
ncbi:MAG: hypothetical protein AAF702_07670 [Chloroflexota bacterium]